MSCNQFQPDADHRAARDILRRIDSADPGWPQFEVEIVHTTRLSHATGDAAAHIGEFPCRTRLRVMAQAGVGVKTVLVGEIDTAGRLVIDPLCPLAIVAAIRAKASKEALVMSL